MRTVAAAAISLFAGLLAACVTPTGIQRMASPPLSADSLPGGSTEAGPVEVLSQDSRYVLAPDGTKTQTYVLRYRIRSLQELGAWRSASAAWSPWYQSRPQLSATVTQPQGQVLNLDPATIVETALPSGAPESGAGRLKLEAPLPGLVVGATVEQTMVLVDRVPMLPGGVLVRAALGLRVPVARSTVEVLVPKGQAARYQVRGIQLDPVQTLEGEHVNLTFTAENLPAHGPSRMLLPPEHPRHAHVVVSTVPSWQKAGASYSAQVDQQVEGADVSPLLRALDQSAPRDAIIAELLRRVHGEIRYMEQPFGLQPILPARPSETLAKRAGDSKDKGVLLIALLKAVGIEAHLALYRAGQGEDVAQALPGIDAFDSTLVYVPGEPPVWIDVTDDLMPMGELPLDAQGRLALVAAAKGPGLVRVPQSSAADNAYLEVRKVTFAEWGPVNVVERTEAKGSMQYRLRKQLLGSGRERVRGSLTGYVQRTYRAKGLGKVEYGDIRDLTRPFTVSVEAVDAHIGYTALTEAKLQLRTPVLFGFVPELLRDAALGMVDPEPDPERRAAAMLVSTRKSDMVFPQGFEAEVRYEIELPTGFEVKVPPSEIEVALGPGAYRLEFSDTKDGRLQVRLMLVLRERRITADQARAFIEGLSKVWQMDVPALELVHTGARLMQAGRGPEAVHFYREQADADPQDALQRARLAEGLLAAGLGGAARVEAEAAAEQAPESVPVLMSLGRVLEHDTFGRPRASGFDQAGATQAFEKVLELEEDNTGALLSLARLKEIDAQARPTEDPAAWKAVAAMYQRLRDQTGDTEFDLRLMVALMWGRDFEVLHDLASKLPPDVPTVAMQLVGAAQTHGAPAAIREIEGLGLAAAAHSAALDAAGVSLARIRAYPLARAMMQAALRIAEDPEPLRRRLASLDRVERVELKSLVGSSPEGVVQRLLFAMLSPGFDAEQAQAIFSPEALVMLDGEEGLARLSDGLSHLQRNSERSEVPVTMLRDNILSLTKFEVSGSAELGYRVQASMHAASGKRQSVWFVQRIKGKYRIVASQATPASLGERALEYLHLGNVKAARQWLAWAEAALPPRTSDDPLAVAPFLVLREQAAPLTVQAAALAAMGPRAGESLAHLEGARQVVVESEPLLALLHALWMAHARERHFEQADLLSEALVQAAPLSDRAVGLRCQSLLAAGHNDEAQAFAQQRQRTSPDDALALSCLGDEALAVGDLAAARTWLRRQVDAGHGDSVTLNNLAWLSLFLGDVTEADVEASVKSNTMTGFQDPSKLHTLAALYAERGLTQQAHELFLKRLELRGADAPEPVDWYLIGRIMEHYELFALAVEAYRRVEPEARAVDSTHRLAAMRLKVLEAR